VVAGHFLALDSGIALALGAVAASGLRLLAMWRDWRLPDLRIHR